MTPTQIARRADALYCETPKRELGFMVAYREADIENLKAENARLRALIKKKGTEMEIKTKLDVMAFLPERAHDTDAGADIRTPEGFTLKAHSSEIVATGVHVQLPQNTVGMLKSKSGLNTRYGIVSEGVIDEGFSGEIIVKLYNLSDHDYLFQRGDKITQLVIMPVHYVTYEQADEIQGGARGSAGYGSTGR